MEVGRRVQEIFCRIITQTTRSNIAQIFFFSHFLQIAQVLGKTIDSCTYIPWQTFSRFGVANGFYFPIGTTKKLHCKNPSKER